MASVALLVFLKKILIRCKTKRALYTIFLKMSIYRFAGYACLIGFFGIGDCLVELSCIDDFAKGTRRPIAVFGEGPIEKLAPFFPSIKRVARLGNQNHFIVEHHMELINFCAKRKHLLFIGHYADSSKDIIGKMRCIYGLKEPGRITFPIIPRVASAINKNQKAVLVVPRSNFYQSNAVHRAIQERVSYFLLNGYEVYVNGECPQYNELSDRNLHYVFWDLPTLFWSAKNVEIIIGIRTGLLDFLVTAGTPIELYSDSSPTGQLLRNVWPLSMWKTSTEITNIIVD